MNWCGLFDSLPKLPPPSGTACASASSHSQPSPVEPPKVKEPESVDKPTGYEEMDREERRLRVRERIEEAARKRRLLG